MNPMARNPMLCFIAALASVPLALTWLVGHAASDGLVAGGAVNFAALTEPFGQPLTRTPMGLSIVSPFNPRASADFIFSSRFEENESQGFVPFTPPNPVSIAPPADPTVIPAFHEYTEFLYDHPTPVQRGMVGNPIQPYRAAVTRGRVLNAAGGPLAGVLVRALDQPEVGYTYTRSDGYRRTGAVRNL